MGDKVVCTHTMERVRSVDQVLHFLLCVNRSEFGLSQILCMAHRCLEWQWTCGRKEGWEWRGEDRSANRQKLDKRFRTEDKRYETRDERSIFDCTDKRLGTVDWEHGTTDKEQEARLDDMEWDAMRCENNRRRERERCT